ncbi:MAG: histidinol dehydrogenase, partial [Fimbriimonadales bacterium]|nr:histidinol dehydrogenase [Fimbriimonadales bacterium]
MEPMTMRVLDCRGESLERVRAQLLRRAQEFPPDVEAHVRAICERVRQEGDTALLAFTRQWDCPTLTHLEASEEEFERAYQQLEPRLLDALRQAIARV